MRNTQIETFICERCGRVLMWDSAKKAKLGAEALDWLIAPNVRYAKKYEVVVVRCPQHVDKWALKHAGLGGGANPSLVVYYKKAATRDADRPRIPGYLVPTNYESIQRWLPTNYHHRQENGNEETKRTQ